MKPATDSGDGSAGIAATIASRPGRLRPSAANCQRGSRRPLPSRKLHRLPADNRWETRLRSTPSSSAASTIRTLPSHQFGHSDHFGPARVLDENRRVGVENLTGGRAAMLAQERRLGGAQWCYGWGRDPGQVRVEFGQELDAADPNVVPGQHLVQAASALTLTCYHFR